MNVGPSSLSIGSGTVEYDFLRRIKSAYRFAIAEQPDGVLQGMWSAINHRKRDVHTALVDEGDEPLARILMRPGDTDLFRGFENCYAECIEQMRVLSSFMLEASGAAVYSDLILLAEAIGARRLRNNEQPNAPGVPPEHPEVAEILTGISDAVGIPLKFPNPFPDEFGLQTPAGLISYRALQAVYQARQVQLLSKKYGGRILEIGAGLGRTAYFSRCLGITDYTIVDLPLTGVAQAAFLGSTIPCGEIALAGEHYIGRGVRIIAPEQLFGEQRQYDLVLNVDSLTEMPAAIGIEYANFARRNARALLSINHEVNEFTVGNLEALAGARTSRHPYWMRKGYVEELFVFGDA
jgi:hypothetical protein